jgi:mRNA-degrading endonuclease RelE of RelBE toxin-antitoxin system
MFEIIIAEEFKKRFNLLPKQVKKKFLEKLKFLSKIHLAQFYLLKNRAILLKKLGASELIEPIELFLNL